MTKVMDRLEKRIVPDPNSGCWLWTGAKKGAGYGQFSVKIDGAWYRRSVHRWVYEFHRGEIPAGLDIDHLCRTPACCNPNHLEPVTTSENVRRGLLPSMTRDKYAAMTHCLRGHEFTPENTRIWINRSGYRCRRCRACDRSRSADVRARFKNKNL